MVAGLLATAFALDSSKAPAAGDCLERPDRAASPRGHWYYHTDRDINRKCWYLMGAAANATAPAVAAPPASPYDPISQQPSFSSFFSTLATGFTPASVPASPPDPRNRDARGVPIVQPDQAARDAAQPARQRRVDAKPATKPSRQASAHPGKEPADEPRSKPLSPAERDALFQEYLRWREEQ
jgi:hypothetical protein